MDVASCRLLVAAVAVTSAAHRWAVLGAAVVVASAAGEAVVAVSRCRSMLSNSMTEASCDALVSHTIDAAATMPRRKNRTMRMPNAQNLVAQRFECASTTSNKDLVNALTGVWVNADRTYHCFHGLALCCGREEEVFII